MKTALKVLLVAALAGCVMAEGISEQTEIYIVAGVLGGVCLLLTVATIHNTVALIGLQTKVAVLQAAGTAAVKAVAETAVAPPPRNDSPKRPRDYPPPSRRDDPYARPPPREDNYRMERAAPPPRPHRSDDRRSAGYY